MPSCLDLHWRSSGSPSGRKHMKLWRLLRHPPSNERPVCLMSLQWENRVLLQVAPARPKRISLSALYRWKKATWPILGTRQLLDGVVVTNSIRCIREFDGIRRRVDIAVLDAHVLKSQLLRVPVCFRVNLLSEYVALCFHLCLSIWRLGTAARQSTMPSASCAEAKTPTRQSKCATTISGSCKPPKAALYRPPDSVWELFWELFRFA